jgi:hypothetical protein
MVFGRGMTTRGWLIRLAACVVLDLLDFTVGRALFAIPWEEGFSSAVLVLLFGWKGLLGLGELVDVTEQIDAFIPISSLTALWAGYDAGIWGRKKAIEPPQTPAQ